MPKFLDLRGKRAAAAFLDARDEPATDPAGDREKKAVPLDGRVVLRLLPVEQIAVLDEQQASRDEVGYVLKTAVDPFRKLGGINLVAGTIKNPDAGLVLFGIDGERAKPDKATHTLRPACLAVDLEVVLGQGSDELRQLDIAEPLVIRPGLGKTDCIARAGLDAEAHAAVEAIEQHSLRMRGLHLPVHRPADQAQHYQDNHPAQHTDERDKRERPSPLSLLAFLARRIETCKPPPYRVGNGHASSSS